jgi:hypothetical protein
MSAPKEAKSMENGCSPRHKPKVTADATVEMRDKIFMLDLLRGRSDTWADRGILGQLSGRIGVYATLLCTSGS